MSLLCLNSQRLRAHRNHRSFPRNKIWNYCVTWCCRPPFPLPRLPGPPGFRRGEAAPTGWRSPGEGEGDTRDRALKSRCLSQETSWECVIINRVSEWLNKAKFNLPPTQKKNAHPPSQKEQPADSCRWESARLTSRILHKLRGGRRGDLSADVNGKNPPIAI